MRLWGLYSENIVDIYTNIISLLFSLEKQNPYDDVSCKLQKLANTLFPVIVFCILPPVELYCILSVSMSKSLKYI